MSQVNTTTYMQRRMIALFRVNGRLLEDTANVSITASDSGFAGRWLCLPVDGDVETVVSSKDGDVETVLHVVSHRSDAALQ